MNPKASKIGITKIGITIPAYNEEKTIGDVVRNIKSVMDSTRYKGNYFILVLDDGSTDKTKEAAKDAGAFVYSHKRNYGLAETFRSEMDKCLELKADIIVHTDADGQYLARDIPRVLYFIEKGYDLVLGSRFRGKIESMPFIKRLGNIIFSIVLSNITGRRISDAQSGFRAFTREVAESIKITSNHTYTQEQIIRAVKRKFSIKEIPIYFAKRKIGKSKLMKNPFEYAAKAIINIIRVYRDYQPLKFFGAIGGALFSIGFITGLYLLYLHLITGIEGHAALLMFCLLMLMIGFQIMIFGLFADMNQMHKK